MGRPGLHGRAEVTEDQGLLIGMQLHNMPATIWRRIGYISSPSFQVNSATTGAVAVLPEINKPGGEGTMNLRKLTMLSVTSLACLIFQVLAGTQAGIAAGEKVETGCGVLRFTYDTALGHTIVCEDIARHQVLPNEPYWQANPAYRKIQFSGYPFPASFGLGPTIYTIPIDRTGEGVGYDSPYAPGEEDLWLKEVNALEAVLRDRPTWTSPTWQGGHPLTSPPLLPVINAGNIFLAKQKYISFANGSGVLYLAQITQEASLPSRANTFYIFQGISDKGPQYISAVFPAFLAIPPQPPTGASFEAQAQMAASELERAKSSAFNPDLQLIEEMVASFQVVYPLPTDLYPVMPIAGTGDVQGPSVSLLLMVALITVAVGVALNKWSRAR